MNGRFPPFLPMAFAVAATPEQARRKAGSHAKWARLLLFLVVLAVTEN
jgi:hypothetical protein